MAEIGPDPSDHADLSVIETDRFRDGMARLSAAINIVTSDGPAGRVGLTVSAVCSVTDTPPTLLVCVNRTGSTHDAITRNQVLCVNVLATHHADLCGAFARKGRDLDACFEAAEWSTLTTGSPVLLGAAVAFDCRIVAAHTVGTHDVLLCEVLDLAISTEPGLVYFDRNHCQPQLIAEARAA